MLEKILLDKKDAPRSKLLIYQFIADFQKSGGSNRKSVSKNIEFTHGFVHNLHIYNRYDRYDSFARYSRYDTSKESIERVSLCLYIYICPELYKIRENSYGPKIFFNRKLIPTA